MKPETPLDFAVFQLSPRRSRCELIVSSHGSTEKLASGSVKPFVTQLKVAEEQFALSVQTIKLEVEKGGNVNGWFTKGTLERFVRFVSTPEILELVNTFDAEMSQLEAARKIYSQGEGDQHSGATGGDGTGTGSIDDTKKELLKAIDVRLVAVRQDLVTASTRASAAGFNPDTVSDLQLFADRFGAHRLKEASFNFISICRRRPDLINTWSPVIDDRAVRTSCGSDMSIDDPTEDHVKPLHQTQKNKHDPQSSSTTSRTEQHSHVDQQTSSTRQLSKSSSATLLTSRRDDDTRDRERDHSLPETLGKDKSEEEEAEKATVESSSTTTPVALGPSGRRLSVQDRINLFENKQKENTSGSGSGGGKTVTGKPLELRRLSSDVSSAPSVVERAVLRRWSGVSDMSIDSSNEKKDVESPLCTPSSSSISESKSSVFSGAPENQGEKRGNPVRIGDDEPQQEASEMQNPLGVYSGKEAGLSKVQIDVKDQTASQAQTRPFTVGVEPVGLNDRGVSRGNAKSLSTSDEKTWGLKGNLGSEPPARDGGKTQVVCQNDGSTKKAGDDAFDGRVGNKVDGSGPREYAAYPLRARGSRSHSRSFSAQFEGVAGSKLEASSAQCMEVDGGQLPQQRRSFKEEPEIIANKDLGSSGRHHHHKVDDFGVQKMKLQKPDFAGRKQVDKSQVGREENNLMHERIKSNILGKSASDDQEGIPTISSMSGERVQRVRQTKGNQELNDELKMKANELEKLFAEHKLRVPGENSNSTRRGVSADVQLEQATSSQHVPPALENAPAQVVERFTAVESVGSSNKMESIYATPVKMINSHDFSDDSRGKFYNKYMQKRDAKLREEWISKRAEKEAKMKAMQDSLEKSKAEMKAKFSGIVGGQDSVASARRRAEKLRSFNFRSRTMEQPIDPNQSEDDGNFPEVLEQKFIGNDRLHSDSYALDSASRSNQNRKALPSRNISSTPRSTGVPAPRSVAKASHSNSGRRRAQTDNLLAQSVPNFSDLRKENTKPSGVSKTTTRPQVRNYARSKTSEEPVIKDEKPRRAQSMRKNSASSIDFKEIPPLGTDDVVLAPLMLDKELNEESIYDKYLKSLESKPFLRKGNGISSGAGLSIAKLKASMESEALKDEEEFDEVAFEAEDSEVMAKEYEGEEGEEELEKMQIKLSHMDNGKLRLSQESDKSSNSGSEIDDSMRSHSHSQVDHSRVSELPSMLPSFHKAGMLLDSPGESPLAWNSATRHPFSYTHEASDTDAFMESPIGSPASWNSHNITQAEADVSRMRKKWGSAQKPSLIATSSSQSRKDVTKGFKRLLKFGRKGRGTESMVDWISATTSEGDDDTEDGRDPASRSSEDLRKSRMGFAQGPDDSFNDSELFCEQAQELHSSIPAPPANFKLREDHISGSSLKAPRSFFSLSTFRSSKGNDAKSR